MAVYTKTAEPCRCKELIVTRNYSCACLTKQILKPL